MQELDAAFGDDSGESGTDDGASRANTVYRRMMKAINSGKIKPGQRVLEKELAAWFNVSRTPVREAIRRLESEGVLSRTDRGLTVARMDDDQVLELYAMREVLEGAAARLAAVHTTNAEIAVMEHILQEEAATESPQDLAEVNMQFHLALWRASRNRYMFKTLRSLQEAFLRLPQTTFSWPGRPAEALKEHREMLAAVASRNEDAAEQAARAHIRNTLQCRLLLNSKLHR